MLHIFDQGQGQRAGVRLLCPVCPSGAAVFMGRGPDTSLQQRPNRCKYVALSTMNPFQTLHRAGNATRHDFSKGAGGLGRTWSCAEGHAKLTVASGLKNGSKRIAMLSNICVRFYLPPRSPSRGALICETTVHVPGAYGSSPAGHQYVVLSGTVLTSITR